MTIQEIQAAIDAKYDARQIINMIADYIEDNPGGGASGIDSVLAIGQSLTTNRILNLDGHELRLEQTGGASYIQIQPDPTNEVIRLSSRSSETSTNSYLFLNSSNDTGWSFELEADKSGTVVSIEGSADENQLEYNAANHVFAGLVALDFVDDAAAATFGVPVGGIYHTSGTLKIRRS